MFSARAVGGGYGVYAYPPPPPQKWVGPIVKDQVDPKNMNHG